MKYRKSLIAITVMFMLVQTPAKAVEEDTTVSESVESRGELTVSANEEGGKQLQPEGLVFYQKSDLYKAGDCGKVVLSVQETKSKDDLHTRTFSLTKGKWTLSYKTADSFVGGCFFGWERKAFVTYWEGGAYDHVLVFDCASEKPKFLWTAAGKGVPDMCFDCERQIFSLEFRGPGWLDTVLVSPDGRFVTGKREHCNRPNREDMDYHPPAEKAK